MEQEPDYGAKTPTGITYNGKQITEEELSELLNPNTVIDLVKYNRDWLNKHGYVCEVKISKQGTQIV